MGLMDDEDTEENVGAPHAAILFPLASVRRMDGDVALGGWIQSALVKAGQELLGWIGNA